jgi:hypothetical protein
MLTFDEVLHVGLTGLDSAVTDWSATINKLKELEEVAENGLRSKADKADWAGENAGITKSFVKKTTKEFSDAAKVAESIRNVLRDALSEFKSAQKSLEDVIQTAPGKGIHIDAEGIVSHLVHPDRRAKNYDGPKPTEADFEAVRATIKAAIDRTTSPARSTAGSSKPPRRRTPRMRRRRQASSRRATTPHPKRSTGSTSTSRTTRTTDTSPSSLPSESV